MPVPDLNYSQRISNLSTSIWIVWWTLCLIKRLPERPRSNRIRKQQRKMLLQTLPLTQQVISSQFRRAWREFRTTIGSIIYSIRRLPSSLRFRKRKKTTWHSTRLVTYSPQLVRMASWSRAVIGPLCSPNSRRNSCETAIGIACLARCFWAATTTTWAKSRTNVWSRCGIRTQ